MDYIVTFFTHSGAIKYHNFLKKNHIAAELMPVPRKLSSNCGIAAKFSFENDIKAIICDEIESIYEINNKEEFLIYSAE